METIQNINTERPEANSPLRKTIKFVLCAVALTFFLEVQLAKAQIPFFGSCPIYTVAIANIVYYNSTYSYAQIIAFLGTWYQYSAYPAFINFKGSCATWSFYSAYDSSYCYYVRYNATYNITYCYNTTNTINVYYSYFDKLKFGYKSYSGVASIYNNSYYITFSSVPYFAGVPYYIIATDYTTYAVVVACVDRFGIYNYRYVWILTRAQYPNAATIQLAYAALAANGITTVYLKQTAQYLCFYNNSTEIIIGK